MTWLILPRRNRYNYHCCINHPNFMLGKKSVLRHLIEFLTHFNHEYKWYLIRKQTQILRIMLYKVISPDNATSYWISTYEQTPVINFIQKWQYNFHTYIFFLDLYHWASGQKAQTEFMHCLSNNFLSDSPEKLIKTVLSKVLGRWWQCG